MKGRIMEITNNIGRNISWALREVELYEEEPIEEQLEAIKAIAEVVQTTLIDELTGWWNTEAFDYFVKELNTLMEIAKASDDRMTFDDRMNA
jgi:hypothetical protein|tara:strand:+ start:1080 stop:1355 length:276 start_codon:yes stop_codon:yes gene_type:complete